jgi:4-amino-4-deoxy-L-arabinose transferase-like glycosyltransferase
MYIFLGDQFPLIKDDLQYNIIAKNILDGNGFSYNSFEPTASRGPVYPLFLASTYFVFGYDYNVVRILQSIIGAITCLLIYLIANKLYDHIIGFYTLIIMIAYPSLIGYSGLLYSETLTAFLLSLFILFYLLAMNKKTFTFFIITGIFLGLLILCYPKFLFLPIVFGFSIYFYNSFQKNFTKYYLALICGVVFMIAPWTLRNFNEFGKLIPVATGSGSTLWHSTLPEDHTEWYFDREPVLSEFKKFFNNPQDSYEQDKFLFSVKTNEIFMKKAITNIKDNPLLFVSLFIKRFFRQWVASNGNSFYILSGATSDYLLSKNYSILFIKIFLFFLQMYIIIFACIGILVDYASNKKNLFSPLFLSIFYLSIINSIFMTQPRYQIPVLGLLLIYTVLGSRWIFLRLYNSKMIRRIIYPLAIKT